MRSRFLVPLFLLILFVQSHAQIIITVAGTGTIGYTGDGGPAVNAQLGDLYYTYPAIDNTGNIFIAQNSNNTIRKINAAGIITTIAGTIGVIGYTGDGGPAINALIYHPTYMVVDNNNNLLFGDRNGDIIRQITPGGIITTITGQFAVTCGVGDGGPLSAAQFRAVSAIAKDAAGNLYISDYGCNTIRKVSTATGIITTIAGNGTWGFSGDGGPATAAQLAYPGKVAVDNAGNVFIADAQNHRIRKISAATGIISTVAGTGTQGYSGDGGPATGAQLTFPGSVVIDNAGNLYIGDDEKLIRKIDPSGIITTFAGNGSYGYSGDGGPPTLAALKITQGRISIDANDNIYFSDDSHGVIRKIINCLTPVVSSQPQPVSLCNNGNANFSATVTNVNNYQWQVNDGTGWTDIINSATYSGTNTNSLAITNATTAFHQYQFRCKLINGCATIYTVAATLSVTTPVTPSVTISTGSLSNCANTMVSFSAVALNAGPTPLYQWKRNGMPEGTNSSLFTISNLNNADIITCEISTANSCVTSSTANSNSLSMTVIPALTATLTIAVSGNGACAGSPVTFTATPTNGGATPSYTWFRNSTNLFHNSPTFTVNDLVNGEHILAAMGSGLACITNPVAVSNHIVAAVSPLVTPTVSITASKIIICKNEPVTFTATTLNPGTGSILQWKKNGVPVGSNTSTYTNNNLLPTDIISCQLNTFHSCATTNESNSNTIAVSIRPDPIPLLDQTTWLCTNSTRTLDAGPFSSYLWNTGAIGQSISVNSIGNYSVSVTDQFGCTGTASTSINNLLPVPAGFVKKDTSVCSYGNILLQAKTGYKNYSWNTGAGTQSISISQPGQYWLQVTDNNNCIGREIINVVPKECLKGLFVPTAFTPDGNGKNDLFKAVLLGNIKLFKLQIFNRWGELVFASNDPNIGWNGTFKGLQQDNAVFIWTCLYQLDGDTVKTEKGTVTLIR